MKMVNGIIFQLKRMFENKQNMAHSMEKQLQPQKMKILLTLGMVLGLLK